jgi:hypothetical protein
VQQEFRKRKQYNPETSELIMTRAIAVATSTLMWMLSAVFIFVGILFWMNMPQDLGGIFVAMMSYFLLLFGAAFAYVGYGVAKQRPWAALATLATGIAMTTIFTFFLLRGILGPKIFTIAIIIVGAILAILGGRAYYNKQAIGQSE